MQHVQLVLDHLRKADLKLKPSKCEWAMKEIPFLGHLLTTEGIKPQPRLLKKVNEFEKPTNLKALRGFLGLTGYYRTFLPNYTKLAKPFYELTKKGVKFTWSPECEQSFQAFKRALTNPPLLIHPDFSKTFVLVTDASEYYIGAALGHEIDGKFRPCAYFTAAITGPALRYCVAEKEALAVFRALKHFEDLIVGYKILILTDHMSLKHILENADKAPTPRLKRRALYMSGFDFQLNHTPGKSHYLADYLSRAHNAPPSHEENSEPELGVDVVLPQNHCCAHVTMLKQGQAVVLPNNHCCAHVTVLKKGQAVEYATDRESVAGGTESGSEIISAPQQTSQSQTESSPIVQMSVSDPPSENNQSCLSDPNDIRTGIQDQDLLSVVNIGKEHQSDDMCKMFYDYIKHNRLPLDRNDQQKVVAKSDYMSIGDNDLLYHHPSLRQKKNKTVRLKAQIVLPPSLRDHVLSTLHGDILAGGHVGRQSLSDKITDRFYWEGMHRDILEFVKACSTCARKKRPGNNPKFEMQKWQEPSYPCEIVSTDIMGPLKVSNSGNKYIITYTCHLTCWTEAFAIPDATARTVADNIVRQLFTRYGVVRQLHSDRGANYCAQLTRAVTSMLNCTQSFTSSPIPNANGRAERINARLNNVITSYVDDDQGNWDDILPYALWASRSVPHARTGISPFLMLFGHDPKFPLDAKPTNIDTLPLSARDYLAYLMKKLTSTREIVRDHVKDYVNKMKVEYDKTCKKFQFQVGDSGYLWNPRAAEISKSKKGKFTFVYTGPYRLTKEVKPYLFQLKRISDGKVLPTYAHSNRFKMAHFPYKRRDLTAPHRPDPQSEAPILQDSESESEREQPVPPPPRINNGSCPTQGLLQAKSHITI